MKGIHSFESFWGARILLQADKHRLAIFPFPVGMSLTKLSLAGNNLVSDITAEDGKITNLFYNVEI
jgi:hypothetical protein